tara:strand:+ start:149 stop:703 length:555 start_codon:yes stop_codon:yes gene_type:complete
MRFALHYRGPLRANGKPAHKNELREHFHRQLSVLWSQAPLSQRSGLLQAADGESSVSLLRSLGGFVFVPLVCEPLKTTCELRIVMLRPEPPGKLVTAGGDIDNRLKTLFDALTLPQEQAIPNGWRPSDDQQPLYCLLEDDNLITSVTVRTEQLLEPQAADSLVDVTIYVRTCVTAMLLGNLDFA